MRIAYQYRLRPTPEQTARFDSWLRLLRWQYNYRLAERFNWWERNRCDVNSCPDCQLTIDRDFNAAINIKYRAVGHSVLKANPRIRIDRWSW
ncbi:helix-turn-helix domain-containing protein [Aphanothece sacrum]|uniref:helix-turn-helix domain-containing protein n=1 Tax=Aphanothece sacrum TaxID=1122 RepID=UPI001D130833|nr:helix-turn-helix domain-containing protein [Aphanothece sacrum]